MSSLTTQGIVTRFVNYRDNDRMLTLLTPSHGRIDVLSRGCKRPKSALMPASELFVQGEFVIYQKNERCTLTSCQIADTFYPLRLDAYRLTCASYMASLCQVASQPNQQAVALYSLLLNGLYRMAYDESLAPLTLTTAFLLQYATDIGYCPRLRRCAQCRTPIEETPKAHFDPVAGGLLCPSCQHPATYLITNDQVAWMKHFLTKGFDALATAPLTDDKGLFEPLRRLVESRLETSIKVSRLLP